jgi:hypothetical protein
VREGERDLIIEQRHQHDMEIFIQFKYLRDVTVLHSLSRDTLVDNFLSFNGK